jgi:hypothetical protein
VTSDKNTFSGKTLVSNTLNCYRLEVGEGTADTSSAIDMKAYGGNTDYDARIIVSNGQSSTSGKGDLTITCNKCIMKTPLTVEGNLRFYGDLETNSAIITPTELSYLSGVTSNIQTQINTTLDNTKMNQSTYISIHGKSYYNSSRQRVEYTYTDYDGTSTDPTDPWLDAPWFGISYPDNCNAVELTYCYYTDIINKQYQGILKYYCMKWADTYQSCWKLQDPIQIVGASAFLPTVVDDGYAIGIRVNNMEGQTNGFIRWTISILYY